MPFSIPMMFAWSGNIGYFGPDQAFSAGVRLEADAVFAAKTRYQTNCLCPRLMSSVM